MRGVYIAHKTIASLAAAKTVLLGTNSSSCVLEILEAHLTTGGQNTVEQITVGLSRVSALGSATGDSVDVQKAESGSPATLVTWVGDLTTEPTYTADPLDVEGVVNVVGIAQDRPADAGDHPPVPFDQRGEGQLGSLPTPLGEPPNQLPVRQADGHPRVEQGADAPQGRRVAPTRHASIPPVGQSSRPTR